MVSRGKVCAGCASPPQGKKLDSGSEEVVERDRAQEGRVERDSRLKRSSTESRIFHAKSSMW